MQNRGHPTVHRPASTPFPQYCFCQSTFAIWHDNVLGGYIIGHISIISSSSSLSLFVTWPPPSSSLITIDTTAMIDVMANNIPVQFDCHCHTPPPSPCTHHSHVNCHRESFSCVVTYVLLHSSHCCSDDRITRVRMRTECKCTIYPKCNILLSSMRVEEVEKENGDDDAHPLLSLRYRDMI